MKNKVISILLTITLCTAIPVAPSYAAELPQEAAVEESAEKAVTEESVEDAAGKAEQKFTEDSAEEAYAEETELVLGGLADPEEELSAVGLADGIMEAEAAPAASVEEMIARALSWKRGGKSVVMDDAFLSGVSSTETDWDAAALGRLGVEENYGGFRSAAASYVTGKYAGNPNSGLSSEKATEWHRLTVALLAAKGDPLNIGGQNLIRDGVYECKVGAPWKQGTNGAIWALIALDSFGYEVPEGASYDREDLIQYLLDHEKAGGGWALSDGLGADADITAMAVQALAPYVTENTQVKEAAERGLAFLRGCQTADGDISGSMAGKESCEATCQTILAFCSMGRDPKDVVSENGKSLIDGLRKYENQADGGFYHDVALADQGSNGMATQQALYTLAGYQRYQQGKSNLYDFRADAQTAQYRIKAGGKTYRIGAGSETLQLPSGTKKIAIENLPIGNYDSAVIEAGGKTYQSSYRRSNGNTPVGQEIPVDGETELVIRVTKFSGGTESRTLKVTADGKVDDETAASYVEEQIDALPDVGRLTLADEKDVAEALEAYEALTETQKGLVKNTAKLTDAEKKIAELKAAAEEKLDADRKALKKKIEEIRTPVEISQKKEIQQYLQELEELGEWSEKAELKAKLKGYLETIAARKAVIAQLDEDIWEQIRPLHLSESDTMTVKALMKRYRALSREEQKLLKNAQSLLDADQFIRELEEEPPKEIKVKGAKNTEVKKTVKTAKQTTKKATTKTNLVKPSSKNGVVSKSEFEKVQGKDQNLQIEGLYGAQLPYTFTFYGKDIREAADFSYAIQAECGHVEEIRKLAEDPFLLCMEKTGPFPGEALLKIKTNLEDGMYLLFTYDSEAMQAEYVKKPEISDGEAVFTLTDGGDYFIAKRAKAGSLKKQSEEKKEADNTSGAGTAEWDENRELAVNGTAAPAGQSALYILLGAAIMAVGVFLGYRIGKNKNSSKEDEEEWEEE